jgi:tRNA uridine 5-carboxymethylaminomethyl modification enzyme
MGVIGAERARTFRAKAGALAVARRKLAALNLSPNEAAAHGLRINHDGVRRSGFDLLGFPDIEFADLRRVWPVLASVDAETAAQIEIDARYAVYLDRQAADIAGFRRDESLAIPAILDYRQMSGLSTEIRQKLTAVRPRTMGQASRIEGVTPAALTLLASCIRRAG